MVEPDLNQSTPGEPPGGKSSAGTSSTGEASRGTWLCFAGILLAGIGILIVLLAGPAHRAGLSGTGLALLLFSIGNLILLVSAASTGLGLILSRGTAGNSSARWSWAALAASIILAINGAIQFNTARSVPAIHDISTDTDRPPEFVAIVPLRAGAPNPPEYAGAQAAALQRAAYPDIDTMELTDPPEAVFAAAVQAIDQLGWTMVATDPGTGRIEATDTTFWFGFKDDVVIRIAGADDITRVDIRSKSRVGMSDVGANAHRIRAFRDQLDSLLAR